MEARKDGSVDGLNRNVAKKRFNSLEEGEVENRPSVEESVQARDEGLTDARKQNCRRDERQKYQTRNQGRGSPDLRHFPARSTIERVEGRYSGENETDGCLQCYVSPFPCDFSSHRSIIPV